MFCFFSSSSDGGDDDEEVGDICDAVEEIRRYPCQALVGELAGGEYVNDVRRLLGARNGDVDNSGGLFQLEVGDESLAEVVRLLQDIHGIASARQRQEDAVLLFHLNLASHTFQLLLFQSHSLGDPQRKSDAVRAAGQRPAGHQGVARDEVHLDDGVVVLEAHETLPHDGVALQQHHQRIRLRRSALGPVWRCPDGQWPRWWRCNQWRRFRSRCRRGIAADSSSSSS